MKKNPITSFLEILQLNMFKEVIKTNLSEKLDL